MAADRPRRHCRHQVCGGISICAVGGVDGITRGSRPSQFTTIGLSITTRLRGQRWPRTHCSNATHKSASGAMMSTGEKVDPKDPIWRPTSANDIDAITGLAKIIHPAFPERPEVFAEKLSLFPSGCYVLVRHEEVIGYGLSHPWNLNCIPPLDSFLKGIPRDADCLYVHDVAVLPEVRGHGSAERYIDLMEECACKIGVDLLVLVSVYNTKPLWAQYGFEVANGTELDMKLRSYGPTAKYMIRNLKSP